MPTVTLYTRRDCCLCDDALALIESVRRDAEFELAIVDVDGDAGLTGRYGERVPVVALNGVDTFEYRVEEDELRAALQGRPQTAGSGA